VLQQRNMRRKQGKQLCWEEALVEEVLGRQDAARLCGSQVNTQAAGRVLGCAFARDLVSLSHRLSLTIAVTTLEMSLETHFDLADLQEMAEIVYGLHQELAGVMSSMPASAIRVWACSTDKELHHLARAVGSELTAIQSTVCAKLLLPLQKVGRRLGARAGEAKIPADARAQVRNAVCDAAVSLRALSKQTHHLLEAATALQSEICLKGGVSAQHDAAVS